MIDLHTHTTASDGSDSPSELVKKAAALGLKAIAVTDHDTVNGISEAINTAKLLNTEMMVIPGIEFSTEISVGDRKKELHILGYNIDYKNEAFVNKTKEIADFRTERNEKMCEALRKYAGSSITVNKLKAINPSGVLTRANFAMFLVDEGIVENKDEAFKKYIDEGCCCYVPKKRISVSEAVRLIKSVGGKPVLAHPVMIKGISNEELENLVSNVAALGIEGLECHYSNNRKSDTERFKHIAKNNHLFITGGSDYHGRNKRLQLGTGYNYVTTKEIYDDFYVPDELLTNIL